MGLKHGVGVNSGTDALTLSVLALSLDPGDEVITVPNTWISTAFAISHAGATPVFVDVDVDTHQMDPKTYGCYYRKDKGYYSVHMYGHPAPMVEIMGIASLYGLRVVEDVAQAPLASVGGRLVGSFGDLACFSFYPSKNLGAFGDGGMVLTDNDELAQSVRQLADYGQSDKFVHKNIGFNSRLDTIQAAVLLNEAAVFETMDRGAQNSR